MSLAQRNPATRMRNPPGWCTRFDARKPLRPIVERPAAQNVLAFGRDRVRARIALLVVPAQLVLSFQNLFARSRLAFRSRGPFVRIRVVHVLDPFPHVSGQIEVPIGASAFGVGADVHGGAVLRPGEGAVLVLVGVCRCPRDTFARRRRAPRAPIPLPAASAYRATRSKSWRRSTTPRRPAASDDGSRGRSRTSWPPLHPRGTACRLWPATHSR